MRADASAVFPYSAASGHAGRAHAAAGPRRRQRARAAAARAGEAALARHLDGEIGAIRRVLTESRDTGRTEQFTAVKFAAPVEPGRIVETQIAGHDGGQLLAG